MRFNSNSFSDGGLEETKLEVPPDCTGDGTSRTNHPFSSLNYNQNSLTYPKKDKMKMSYFASPLASCTEGSISVNNEAVLTGIFIRFSA